MKTNRYGEDVRKLSIWLPAELLDALRTQAQEQRTTITALVETGVRAVTGTDFYSKKIDGTDALSKGGKK